VTAGTPEELALLLRSLAPRVLAATVRRYGRFDLAEDAVQEALIAAVRAWRPSDLPDEPLAWLCRVAHRRLTDMLRSEQARQLREERHAMLVAAAGPVPAESGRDTDDSLVLLLMCCHPTLPREGQVALTLRAVGGLTTEEIARAFHVPTPTMGQRISRAKQQIKRSGVPFHLPPPAELGDRLAAVQQVLYLIFNEGYTATTGEALQRLDLSSEAIRLARMVLAAVPDDGEAAGLLALMLLVHARRHARTGPDGEAVPLLEQDHSRWDRSLILEGAALLTGAMSRGALGPYQLQAAIAAVYDEAPSAEETDWLQICALYRLLESVTDNPVVRLNHAVAIAMTRGPAAGLDRLSELAADPALAHSHRPSSVRAHLLELAGDVGAAIAAFEAAARQAPSSAERRHLLLRASRLGRHAGLVETGPPAPTPWQGPT
jgi:RNA polymerase sigma factor (sigma-70 family)